MARPEGGKATLWQSTYRDAGHDGHNGKKVDGQLQDKIGGAVPQRAGRKVWRRVNVHQRLGTAVGAILTLVGGRASQVLCMGRGTAARETASACRRGVRATRKGRPRARGRTLRNAMAPGMPMMKKMALQRKVESQTTLLMETCRWVLGSGPGKGGGGGGGGERGAARSSSTDQQVPPRSVVNKRSHTRVPTASSR